MSPDQKDIATLLEMLKKGNEHLTAISQSMKVPFDPEIEDPRRLHNMYVRNLTCAYVSKWSELSSVILYAVQNNQFLTYALCGRALIESVATLRYYVVHRYKPLFDQGQLGPEEMRELIEIDDLHLRGSRFDWDAFLSGRFVDLREAVIATLKDKKSKTKAPTGDQINVLTCIQKWALVTPQVQIVYDLFCDLVHPNVGSTFLVASIAEQDLYFTQHHGDPLGKYIVEKTLELLLTTTQKPFGECLSMLSATMWKDDEL